MPACVYVEIIFGKSRALSMVDRTNPNYVFVHALCFACVVVECVGGGCIVCSCQV